MADSGLPEPPDGLADAGRGLWVSVLADLDTGPETDPGSGWELDARELHFLERACRCADELASLEEAIDRDGVTTTGSRDQTIVHPALSEARQLRLTQLRLLSAIEMVDPQTARKAATPAQARARKAADTRWGLERARHG